MRYRRLSGLGRGKVEDVWGSWFIVVLGATAGLVMLLMALVVGATPLLGLLIFALVALVVGLIALGRRGIREAQDETVGGEALRGRDASGAPVAGEGGAPPPGS
jgi:membrane protein implicated in regulation of membrane protease activity